MLSKANDYKCTFSFLLPSSAAGFAPPGPSSSSLSICSVAASLMAVTKTTTTTSSCCSKLRTSPSVSSHNQYKHNSTTPVHLRDPDCALPELLPVVSADQLPLHSISQGPGLHRGHRPLCHKCLFCLLAVLGHSPPAVCWYQGNLALSI